MRSIKVSHRVLVVSAGILAGLAIIVASAASVQAAYQNRVLPRTVVAGVNLSGKSRVEANQILAEQANKLEQTPITLSLNGNSEQITARDLGVSLHVDQIEQVIFAKNDPLAWLKPHYWKNFFERKALPLTYKLDDEDLRKSIEEKLKVASTPTDAKLTVTDNALTVNASQPGTTININDLKTQLAKFFTDGTTSTIAVTTGPQIAPAITTEQATTVKADIEQKLHPVTLYTDLQQYPISVADQYGLITYSTDNGQLKWQITQDKVQEYLSTKISGKINVKMTQQQLENGTDRVLTTGIDGKQVDLANLTPNVYQTITGQKANNPIPIPIKTIAYTTTHVEPGYIANLFPGLYVDVNLTKQRMYIMDGANVTREFLISSGLPSLPTPEGQFYIMNKIKLARSPLYKDLWMPNWNALTTSADLSAKGYEGYGVHNLPCLNQACTVVEGASHLGHPVSHGCIRLAADNSQWFYDNIPVGTPVHIHK